MTFCVLLEMEDLLVPKFILEHPKDLAMADVKDSTEPINDTLEYT